MGAVIMRLYGTIIVAILLTVPASGQVASPQLPDLPAPPPWARPEGPPPESFKLDVRRGDEWRYEVRDFLTHEVKAELTFVVADVLADEIDVRVTSLNPTTKVEKTFPMRFDRDWRLIENPQILIKDRTEPSSVLDHPEIGKSWVYSYGLMHKSNGFTKTFYGRARIVAWERIVLGSGQAYDAFKIERRETDVRPADKDVATGAAPTASRVDVLTRDWWAPAVNRPVRGLFMTRINGRLLEGTDTGLIEYQRRSD